MKLELTGAIECNSSTVDHRQRNSPLNGTEWHRMAVVMADNRQWQWVAVVVQTVAMGGSMGGGGPAAHRSTVECR